METANRKVSNSGYFVGKLVASQELHGSELYFPGDGYDYPVRAAIGFPKHHPKRGGSRVGSFRTMHQKVVCWKAFLVVMVLVAPFKNRF